MKTNRRYLLSIIFALVLALGSCTKKTQVPAEIIPPEKMTQILEVIYLLEGFFSTQTHYRFDTLGPEMIGCFDSVFSKYDIKVEDFDTSFSWYARNPEILDPIYDSVLFHLSDPSRY